MIDGVKAGFTGEEVIRGLDARIEVKRAAIQFRRDEIAGNVLPPGDVLRQVPAETVEREIQDIEHSIPVLTLIRDRLLPGATYLLGKKGMKLAGLMPARPTPLPDLDPKKEIRWVTRAVEY